MELPQICVIYVLTKALTYDCSNEWCRHCTLYSVALHV